MNLAKRLSIPAIAAVTVLAGTGTQAAVAATSSGTVTASVADSRAAAHLTEASSPDVPAPFKWLPDGQYPTLHACKAEGDHIIFYVNPNYIFKCIEYSGGEYLYWELFIGVPE
jgi:hypothetical protein